jgi:proteasome lid subunit RPN8/RPN11
VHVGDWVLRAIEAEIAAHPPERGGALLGPPQRLVVTHFAPDPEAATTSASYRPSRALDARVKQLELDEGLELKGIVHSHPRGLDHPSEHDAAELATGLRLNGHMASYLAPIVTGAPEGELEAHELALPSGKISFFAGHRTRSGSARVRPCRAHVVPLLRDLETSDAWRRNRPSPTPEAGRCSWRRSPFPETWSSSCSRANTIPTCPRCCSPPGLAPPRSSCT